MNYIDLEKPKSERHQKLAETKEFICKCDRCEAGDTPDELEALLTVNEAANHRKQKKSASSLLKMMIDQLPIREKIQGPLHPPLIDDMIAAVAGKITTWEPFSAEDICNMRLLMEKVAKAYPIAYGTDHSKFSAVLMMNQMLSQM